jgi:hypothetical protein
MCVIVFGRQLVTVNNSAVSNHIHIQSDALSSLALPRLVAGQLIASISPLRFSGEPLEQPQTGQTSLAAVCARVLSQRATIRRQIATKFREQLAGLRDAFNYGDAVPIVDFRPPDDDAGSDTSFQGRRLRRVVMPKRAKTRGDYSDEGSRTEFEKEEWTSDYSRSSSTTSFPPSSSS